MGKYNKPMDRDYFKKKDNPKWDAKRKLTECCEQPIDHEVLNVFKKDDWEQIEEHVRQQLHDYSHAETITAKSCPNKILNSFASLSACSNRRLW